ncbi:ATP-binding cassette domain-containing protein [uncultured Enterococcus sp.]|uniref:ABC transporter ATP-binding protein n=1 Tax=uncultured Enterococcus sp. TaxID=167972 RepID=UPI002AA7B90D|nr:ATP-binding cassette domain-containing protein [uncultured Enterococcus sp.]
MGIRLEDLSFSYGTEKIIEHVNFTFENNRTYTLLGRSGVGKSTLLSLLKGFQQPEAGRISYEQTSEELVEVVFQDQQLFPWQTVSQAVEMPLKIRKLPKTIRKEKVANLLQDLGLTDYANKFSTKLSGGQKQRTAMARGLITEPDFLLLDEPTSSLDPQTKELAQELILSEQKRRGNTVITVTHDIEEAVFLGEIILIMTAGGFSIFENPTFQHSERRDSIVFYEFCIKLRSFLKEENSQ